MRCECGKVIPIKSKYCKACSDEIDEFFKQMEEDPEWDDEEFEDFCSSHYLGMDQSDEYP